MSPREPRHIRLPFMDPLVLAIQEDIRARDGNPDGLYKTETRRLGEPRAKAGDIMDVCEALTAAESSAVAGPNTAVVVTYRADDFMPRAERDRLRDILDAETTTKEAGRFVECENALKASVKAGEWSREGDLWILTVKDLPA